MPIKTSSIFQTYFCAETNAGSSQISCEASRMVTPLTTSTAIGLATTHSWSSTAPIYFLRQTERHHGYIQWLFPIRESGMNNQAQVVEAEHLRNVLVAGTSTA
jgi:hypothetical protein